MWTPAEERLRTRIGAGPVEGGDENDTPMSRYPSPCSMRTVEIAGDMLRLYELIASLRTDDGYGTSE
jgi:hypothetical protein